MESHCNKTLTGLIKIGEELIFGRRLVKTNALKHYNQVSRVYSETLRSRSAPISKK